MIVPHKLMHQALGLQLMASFVKVLDPSEVEPYWREQVPRDGSVLEDYTWSLAPSCLSVSVCHR